MQKRQARVKRETTETQISLSLNIDGTGKSSISSGVGFFDHMLTLMAKHGTLDLELKCKGDLHVDAHHTVEDCGLALGQAFVQALGDKKGIKRYGTGFDPRNPFTGEAYVPMDETLARCVIDFGGRPHFIWRGLDDLSYKTLNRGARAATRPTKVEKKQDMSSAFRFGLAKEFFQAFANESKANVHLELLYGEEPHHVVEALFKSFGRAIDAACQHDPRIAHELPSTKGKL
jgi:imidazoleglycerol-phosphate dehydratase